MYIAYYIWHIVYVVLPWNFECTHMCLQNDFTPFAIIITLLFVHITQIENDKKMTCVSPSRWCKDSITTSK